MTVSIPSLLINGLVGGLALVVGILLCRDAPSVRGLKDGMLGLVHTLVSKDAHVHPAVFGALFAMLGIVALANLAAIVAKGHGFWMG